MNVNYRLVPPLASCAKAACVSQNCAARRRPSRKASGTRARLADLLAWISATITPSRGRADELAARHREPRGTAGVVLIAPLSTVDACLLGRSGDVDPACFADSYGSPVVERFAARHLFARERRSLAIAGELGMSRRSCRRRDASDRDGSHGLPLASPSRIGEAASFAQPSGLRSSIAPASATHLAKVAELARAAIAAPILTITILGASFPRVPFSSASQPDETWRHLAQAQRRYALDALTGRRSGGCWSKKILLTSRLDGDRQEAYSWIPPSMGSLSPPRGSAGRGSCRRRPPHRHAA